MLCAKVCRPSSLVGLKNKGKVCVCVCVCAPAWLLPLYIFIDSEFMLDFECIQYYRYGVILRSYSQEGKEYVLLTDIP